MAKSKITENIQKEDSTEISTNEIVSNSIICNVLYVNKNKFAVNFLGYGIEFKAEHDIDASIIGKTIEIEYEGEIGFPNFVAKPKYNFINS